MTASKQAATNAPSYPVSSGRILSHASVSKNEPFTWQGVVVALAWDGLLEGDTSASAI